MSVWVCMIACSSLTLHGFQPLLLSTGTNVSSVTQFGFCWQTHGRRKISGTLPTSLSLPQGSYVVKNLKCTAIDPPWLMEHRRSFVWELNEEVGSIDPLLPQFPVRGRRNVTGKCRHAALAVGTNSKKKPCLHKATQGIWHWQRTHPSIHPFRFHACFCEVCFLGFLSDMSSLSTTLFLSNNNISACSRLPTLLITLRSLSGDGSQRTGIGTGTPTVVNHLLVLLNKSSNDPSFYGTFLLDGPTIYL